MRLNVLQPEPMIPNLDPHAPGPDRVYAPKPDASTEKGRMERDIVRALRRIHDPEIPRVSIFDLGLIYGVDIDDSANVKVRMTLTAPNCPMAQHMVEQAQHAAEGVFGVQSAEVELVWEPSWAASMMSEAAILELNL